jgi:hypothetical protein
VLVGAGQEQHVIAVEPLEAGERIGGQRLVGLADMRRPLGYEIAVVMKNVLSGMFGLCGRG